MPQVVSESVSGENRPYDSQETESGPEKTRSNTYGDGQGNGCSLRYLQGLAVRATHDVRIGGEVPGATPYPPCHGQEAVETAVEIHLF